MTVIHIHEKSKGAMVLTYPRKSWFLIFGLGGQICPPNMNRVKLTMIQKLHVVLFFCKCMECSMAQYLQKGVELFEYFPFKELHRAFFLYWCGVLNEVNNEFLTWRALCHTFLCITMEYSMRQNLTKAMENSTLLQFKFNLNLNTTSTQSQPKPQINLSLNYTSTSAPTQP